MPSGKINNLSGRLAAPVQESRRNSPLAVPKHASKIMPLTEKEQQARRMKFSNYGGSGFGNTMMSTQTSFYSAQLSTDFLELPQSRRERHELYRHFYNSDPIVGQAIDLHTELPLSKVRLAPPKPLSYPPRFKDEHDYSQYILDFFSKMCKRLKLFQRLISAVHHYWLDGNAYLFAEDSTVEVPESVGYKTAVQHQALLHEDGRTEEVARKVLVEQENREDQEYLYYQEHYKGWDRLVVLTETQVQVTGYSFTDQVRIELLPSARDRDLLQKAEYGDDLAAKMAEAIPDDVRDCLRDGKLIPLGTDPDEGSFVYHLAGRRHADDTVGQSILDRCLRTLVYRDKLRQAQTQIASRAMTPKRLVWGENLSHADVEDLREQVDLALVDPDYTIVTNYEIHWEEQGARDRLLDLSSEYEETERQLRTGLGVTESLLSGETLYSGDRLKLEVINQRYLYLREILQEYVEENLFKPVARRKGFVEKDQWGGERVLYPKLSFTRLPLRDSQDTYDALFNLYQKGSVDIGVILEMFNLDPDDTRVKIERDMFTVNDAIFNEVIRTIYGEVGRSLAEKTDIGDRIAQYLKLKMAPQASEGDERF